MVRDQRWSRVRNIVNNYHDIRAMCCRFLSNIPEAVANNEYKAAIRMVGDDTVELAILGETVHLSFDYVVHNDEVYGAIRCDQMLPNNEKMRLFSHYIDWDGYAYEAVADGKRIHGFHNPNYPNSLLFLICEALIAQHSMEGSNASV